MDRKRSSYKIATLLVVARMIYGLNAIVNATVKHQLGYAYSLTVRWLTIYILLK